MSTPSDRLRMASEAASTARSAFAHELRARADEACLPHAWTILDALGSQSVSVIRTPRSPVAVVCDPPLRDGDFACSDLIHWIRSGRPADEEALRAMRAIIDVVHLVDSAGLPSIALGTVVRRDDDRPTDDDRDDHPSGDAPGARMGEANGLLRVDLPCLQGRTITVSDSSLAHPDAVRISPEGGSVLLGRTQAASLVPVLMRFARTGSVGEETR